MYDYTYYPSYRFLVSNTTNESWYLTKLEHKLIRVLIKKEFVSKEELLNLFSKIEHRFNTVSAIKSRLCKKTNIDIITIKNIGFKLISNIELRKNYIKENNNELENNYISKDKLKEILYKDYGETIYDYHYAYEELFNEIENLL